MSLSREWSVETGPVVGVAHHAAPSVLAVWIDPASAVGPVVEVLSADDGGFRGAVETVGAIESAEYHEPSSLLIVTTERRYCYAVDPATGSARWEARADGAEEGGTDGSTRLYGGTDGVVYLYDERSLTARRISDGTRKWTTELPAGTRERMNAAKSVEGVYADSDPVVVEAGDGVYAVDGSDGSIRWRIRDRNPTVETTVGSFVVVAGDENWYVLDRTDRSVRAEYSAETPHATGDGRLFVSDGSRVTAYALAADPAAAVERSDPTRAYEATDGVRTTVYGVTGADASDGTEPFCPRCGADVTDADGADFCSACGTGLPDGANFCPECGEEVTP